MGLLVLARLYTYRDFEKIRGRADPSLKKFNARAWIYLFMPFYGEVMHMRNMGMVQIEPSKPSIEIF
jgi:hypothetical protein